MNNLNSYFVKNYFHKRLYSAFFLTLVCLAYSQAQSQAVNTLNFENLSVRQLREDFLLSQEQWNSVSLAGFYTNLNEKITSQPQNKREYHLGHDSLISYYYLQPHLSTEDQILLKGIPLDIYSKKLAFTGPISGRARLEIIDNPPYNNSWLHVKGSIYRPKGARDFGDAGACQVNPFCLDGSNVLIDAAVHILWINGSIAGFCSGTLINNTAQDFKPYVLSAEHCAINPSMASSFDFSRWVFTFNYHSRTCANPSSPQTINQQRLVGANLRARSNDNGGDTGSDLLLVELQDAIPPSFNAYFAGWNRWSSPAKQGSCFHFPSGDILKVSTFRKDAESSSFTSLSEDTHWLIEWSANSAGFGTTEAGSSGAAIFDQNHLIVGTLTGGSSDCSEPDAPDFFGRFDYHWDKNGNTANRRLKDWLDPLNSGVLALEGLRQGEVKNYINANSWSLVPNPLLGAELKLIGLNDLNTPVQIRISNIQGKILADDLYPPLLGGEISLNFDFEKSGLYLLQIVQNESMATFKILKP